MTRSELARATGEFEREFVADSLGTMSPGARARRQRAMRKKPGRPRVGQGTKAVSVTIEKGLLKRIDSLAKKIGTTRARLIAVGLDRLLRESGARTGGSRSRAA